MPDQEAAGPSSQLVVSAADIEPKDVKFLWHPYLPLGKLSILAGDPGAGKSTLGYAVATAVSKGAPLPGLKGAVPQGRVLVMSAEDDPEDTIVPRLISMGADLTKVDLVPLDRAFVLDEEGLQQFRQITGAGRYLYGLLDPLGFYLGAERDMWRQNEVREMLQGLAGAAKVHEMAVLGVMHLNKSEGKAIYRLLGSVDFVAAPRSVLLAHDDEGPRGRALLHAKSNVGPKGDPLGFELMPPDGSFVWRASTDLTMADFDHRLKQPGGDRRAVRDMVKGVLLTYVDWHGPVRATRLNRFMKAAGVSKATLRRAREELGDQLHRWQDEDGVDWWETTPVDSTPRSVDGTGTIHSVEQGPPLAQLEEGNEQG